MGQGGASRFAGLSKVAARTVLLLMAAVIAYGLFAARSLAPPDRFTPGKSDAAFYRAVVARVRQGEPYDQAAITEQRARGYPLKPFVVVRPPLLAELLARVPNLTYAIVLETLLALGVIGAWAFRLRHIRPGPRQMGWTMFFVFTGVGAAMTGEGASLFHEAWAGLLISLSLVLRTEKRFAAAVVIGLLAALVRELAIPYLLVMAAFAAVERRRGEAVAFSAALLAACVALALHAHAVGALVTSQDPSSQGWVKMGGWPFVLATTEWNGIVAVLGPWSAAVVFPVALIGVGSWKDAAANRVLAVLLGYAAGFLVLGRPENFYWGLLTAPLVGIGLALAPWALRDLGRRAFARTSSIKP